MRCCTVHSVVIWSSFYVFYCRWHVLTWIPDTILPKMYRVSYQFFCITGCLVSTFTPGVWVYRSCSNFAAVHAFPKWICPYLLSINSFKCVIFLYINSWVVDYIHVSICEYLRVAALEMNLMWADFECMIDLALLLFCACCLSVFLKNICLVVSMYDNLSILFTLDSISAAGKCAPDMILTATQVREDSCEIFNWPFCFWSVVCDCQRE